MSEQVINADPEELSIIEDFFRIHFCATPDILEETLPQLSSIKQNLKLSSDLKEALEDSGPCIMLLNHLLEDQLHYLPSDHSIIKRFEELDTMLESIKKLRNSVSNIEYKSILAAIRSYHLRETQYDSVLTLMLNIIHQTLLIKSLLPLLTPSALHKSCPFVPIAASDGEFTFEDLSDIDPDLQARTRKKEQPETILQWANSHDHGQEALFLTLSGIISRDDFLLFIPEAESTSIIPDPVAITPSSYLTQSLTVGENKPILNTLERLDSCYTRSPDYWALKQFTGASATEEFSLNRIYASTAAEFTPEPPGEMIDLIQSLPYITGAGEIFTDQEIDIERLYFAAGDISIGRIHPGLYLPLADLYDQQTESIIQALKKARTISSARNVVISRIGKVLTDMSDSYYRSEPDAFVRLTNEAVRGFPQSDRALESLEWLSGKVDEFKSWYNSPHDENSPPFNPFQNVVVQQPCKENNSDANVQSNGQKMAADKKEAGLTIKTIEEMDASIQRVKELILPMFRKALEEGPYECNIPHWQLNLITKFSKFFKLFIRKFYPGQSIKPIFPLFDASVGWKLVFEEEITQALNDLGLSQFDPPESKFPTPLLDNMLQKSAEEMATIVPVDSGQKINRTYFQIRDNNYITVKLL